MKPAKAVFATEADLCRAFVAALPEGWTAYPESCGFDIVLVRAADGVQVGIEAKLSLNAIVVGQIVEGGYDPCSQGPDFRAVLVPAGQAGSLKGICRLLGITVIGMMDDALAEERHRWRTDRSTRFDPKLPEPTERYWSASHQEWIDWAPMKRLQLPDYVPDVDAGHSAPIRLTEWKIRAIKIAVIAERRGVVTREDFKAVGIDWRRWINPYTKWLSPSDRRGAWIAGPCLGTFKAQHPTNYDQIAADYEKWSPKTGVAA